MQQVAWNKRNIFLVTIFTVVLFWIMVLLFWDRLIPHYYMLAAALVVFLFFWGVGATEKNWSNISSAVFQKRLILYSLLIRFAAVTGLYFFYSYMTGQPYEFHAVDSLVYHQNAVRIAGEFKAMNFDFVSVTKELEFSDKGYNLYLGLIYSLFGPDILVPRFINAIFSTLTVRLIYRTATILLGEKTGRLASIMAMFLPNFLLYLGTHLKEPLMVFLVMTALYTSTRIIRLEKRDAAGMIALLISVLCLFMFRTILAFVAFSSFIAFAILYRPVKGRFFNYAVLFIIIGGFIYLAAGTEITKEIAHYYEKSTSGLSENMEFRANREGGNRLALMASAPLFITIIFMAPFPSFVDIYQQENLWIFLGSNIIRNLYAFFAIAGLIYLIRNRFRETSLLLFFCIGYLLILANSGFAISERFHLPVVPVLLMLAATGVERLRVAKRTYYQAYLVLLVILVIGWNYVKLAGRA